MLGQLDMSLILPSLFLILIRHIHSQTYYKNQVTNVQRVYHILTYKKRCMLWQTSIMDSDKRELQSILEIRQTLAHLSGNINYRISFNMSNPIMPPTSLSNLCLGFGALRTDEKSD